MTTFEIDADLAEVKARLKSRLEILRDQKTPLSKMATQLYKSVLLNFKTESADQKPWKKLAPSTLYAKQHRKRRRTANPLLLQDTGYLRNSIYPETGADYARASTNVPYAAPLHFGTKDGRIPGRKFILVRRESRENILNIARSWAFEGK